MALFCKKSITVAIPHERINQLLTTTNYRIVQFNGQRIYASPRSEPDNIESRKGSEVFVGKLPRDMYEDELVPLFEQVGEIHHMRLMMDFSGLNRGYAFVTYRTRESANLAVQVLHGAEIRPGKLIGVYKSLDNCRLFAGGIPVDKTREQVLKALAEFVEGIKDVIMYRSQQNPNLNRGYVFIEFESHREAAMARRKLSPGSLFLWGAAVLVDWADPLPDVDPAILKKVTKLYIRNLDQNLGDDGLWNELTKYIPSDYIVKSHQISDYAFIHFASRKAAEEALELLQGVSINGERMEVSWARPKVYSKSYRLTHPPEHYCTSLPPRLRKHIQNHKEKQYNSSKSSARTNSQSPSSSGMQSISPALESTMQPLPPSGRSYTLFYNQTEARNPNILASTRQVPLVTPPTHPLFCGYYLSN